MSKIIGHISQIIGPVVDVAFDAADEENAIYEAVMKQIEHGPYKSEPIYGDGHAGEKIADILSKVEVNIQKRIAY